MQSPADSSLKSRMENTRNFIAILLVVGVVLLIYTAAMGAPSFLFWILTIAVAALFYFRMGNFLSKPSINQIKSLQSFFYVFIITWILGIGLDLGYWGGLYPSTILALLLALSGTYLLQQFISDAKTLVNVELPPQQPPPPIQQPEIIVQPQQVPSPPRKRPQYCPSCGTSLAALAESTKFCPNCGSKIA